METECAQIRRRNVVVGNAGAIEDACTARTVRPGRHRNDNSMQYDSTSHCRRRSRQPDTKPVERRCKYRSDGNGDKCRGNTAGMFLPILQTIKVRVQALEYCNMFAKNANFHSYGTRNRDCVHVTAWRLTLRKYSIRFGPILWN